MPRVYRSARAVALQTTIKETTQLEWASEYQKKAFEHGPTPLCLSGGFGSAKTWVACLKILWLADTFPGSRWVVARRRWTELQKTTMQTFFKVCPAAAYLPYGKRADSEKILRLNNGSEIYWLYFDDPEIATVLRGLEINGFFIDQAEEVQEEIFEVLSARLGRWDQAKIPARLRAACTDEDGRVTVPPYAIIACNPDNELHWIYRRFHPESPEHYQSPGLDPDTGQPLPSYKEQGYVMVTMPSDSNKFLSKTALNQLKRRDESFQKRYRRGEWGIPEGQIHEIPKISVIDGDPGWVADLLKRAILFRTFDHGDTAPTSCLWWALDKDGNVFCYREYYVALPKISVHREAIARLSGAYDERPESYIRDLADPSIFRPEQRQGGEAWSVSGEYSDATVGTRENAIFWQRGDNDEMGTRNRINEFLYVDPNRKHPVTGLLGAPRLYFIRKTKAYPNGCERAILETNAQRRIKVGTSLGKPIFSDERDDTIPDHAYDCVRYFVASRPASPQEKAAPAPAGSFNAVKAQMKAARKAGLHQELSRQAKLSALASRYARR